MAFKQQPLKQEDFTMKIVKDLGKTTATEFTTHLARYAIFECTECNTHFKARAEGTSAKKQKLCQECTRDPNQYYKHPLYAIWNGIKQRCYSPKRKDYNRYGGIGITMCDEWINSAPTFIEWCLANGWDTSSVVDKDIKCRQLAISPAIYSPDTITFITAQENAEEANAKVVQQFTEDGTLIAEFPSTVKAAASVGVVKSSIANCCRGINKTCKSFVWKYKI